MLEKQQSPLAISMKRLSEVIHESQAVLMCNSDQSRIDPAGIKDAREASIAAGDQPEVGQYIHTRVSSCASISLRSDEDRSG